MKLMEPEIIRTLQLPNRLIQLATHLGYCTYGNVTDKLVRFYEERAKYQPGLIIVGGCYTEHLGMSSPTMIGLSKDSHIKRLSDLVAAVHKYDVPIAAQLYHAGRYAKSIILGEQAVSASAVPCRLTRETPRPLDIEEIHQTIENFSDAALRAVEAGFDAIEILGSAGYLINQFLAPLTNKRNDQYGGSLSARMKFPLELISSIRRSVGPDYPIIYRMSGADMVEDGLTLDDNKIIAPEFQSYGIDCFDVTGGWHESRTPQITMDVPRGHFSYLAEGISEVVDVPVIACNRINSPRIAESILTRGKVQLIGMSRGFIADPTLPEKIRGGRGHEVRVCIGCNQGCLDRVFMLGPVTCAINPEAEHATKNLEGHDSNGRIAVVGGGPAGMEAARILRLRGFEVVLFEKQRFLGGSLRLASRVPGRGEFAAYVSHMIRTLQRIGVRVELEKDIRIQDLTEGNFDHVFLATGALPTAPSIDGVENPHVTTAYEALQFKMENLGTVAVLGGSALGCYVALYLASKCDEVHLFESGSVVGSDLGRTTRWIIIMRLKEGGVQVHTGITLNQISSRYIVIEEDGEMSLLTCDTVVSASRPQPDRRLEQLCMEFDIPHTAIDSSTEKMDMLQAVHSAHKIAKHFTL